MGEDTEHRKLRTTGSAKPEGKQIGEVVAET